MLTKSEVINTITLLPDQFSIDDLVDKMILLAQQSCSIKKKKDDKRNISFCFHDSVNWYFNFLLPNRRAPGLFVLQYSLAGI